MFPLRGRRRIPYFNTKVTIQIAVPVEVRHILSLYVYIDTGIYTLSYTTLIYFKILQKQQAEEK